MASRKISIEDVNQKMNYLTARNEIVQKIVTELSYLVSGIQDSERTYIYPNNRAYTKADESGKNDQDIIDEMADMIPDILDYILKF